MNNLDEYKLSTPPENDEPRELERCDLCRDYFEHDELTLHLVDLKPLQVCYFCLTNINQ